MFRKQGICHFYNKDFNHYLICYKFWWILQCKSQNNKSVYFLSDEFLTVCLFFSKWICKREIQAYICMTKIISFTVMNSQICIHWLMRDDTAHCGRHHPQGNESCVREEKASKKICMHLFPLLLKMNIGWLASLNSHHCDFFAMMNYDTEV